MKNIGRTIAIALVLAAASQAPAGSIWARGTARTRAITTDDTARNIGDNLTISIDEQSRVGGESTREMEKTSSRSNKMSGTLDMADLVGGVGKKVFNFPKMDFSSDNGNNFDGSSGFDNDRSMIDQITVTVEDVLPNGNMVVLGKRIREVDGEKQTITVSGIVRPSDVNFDNTVRSDRVAEFHLVYRNSGQGGTFTNPGWLARVLNFLNPF
ncbi:MAG: flagellar basal body L-ring protein FlgH, partial [Phycisphaerae bacterium]